MKISLSYFGKHSRCKSKKIFPKYLYMPRFLDHSYFERIVCYSD